MSELFTIEDSDNIRAILLHHLGDPRARDDNGQHLSRVNEQDFMTLERDLLRYCTRLRCQPQTAAHTDSQGYHVPKHRLAGDD